MPQHLMVRNYHVAIWIDIKTQFQSLIRMVLELSFFFCINFSGLVFLQINSLTFERHPLIPGKEQLAEYAKQMGQKDR
jgi:hypothetical protein